MPKIPSVADLEQPLAARKNAIALGVVALGFALRAGAASVSYLNPDEAFQVLLASPDTMRELYASAIRWPQPPLFVALLHAARQFVDGELGLRLLPAAAGAASAWAAYRWLLKSWSSAAALTAAVVLALAPNLVYLGAELRAQNFALLLAAWSLYWLDSAVEQGSARRMAAFASCQWLAILSDYSAGFLFIAAGGYFILRIREKSIANEVRMVWEFGQMAVVITYSFLFATQWQTLSGGIARWLTEAYPRVGENPASFAARATGGQFAYLFPGVAAAVLAMLVFGWGLFSAWRMPPRGRRAKAVVLGLPFLAAWLAAMGGMHPYGRSRYGGVLAVFIAVGLGIGIDRLFRARVAPVVLGAFFLVPAWHVGGLRGYDGATGREYPRQAIRDAVSFLRENAPSGSPILTEGESRSVLAWYLGERDWLPELKPLPSEEALANYRVFATRFSFASPADVAADAATFRKQAGLEPETPVWVFDAGYTTAAGDGNLGPRLAAYRLAPAPVKSSP
ncbi:MAG: glycosyltransferase family 39 protein [Bryobacteraceae bacterium]|nr:glycosyltransferase family 39 protein [Bryobacteraceae bacterium]